MAFMRLPNEILRLLLGFLDNERDISAFSRVSHRLHAIAGSHLYKYNVQYSQGSALFWYCQREFSEKIQFLLELGADPNVLDKTEQMPLHYAAKQGNIKIASSLLQYGAILNTAPRTRNCTYNLTPFLLAVEHGQHDMAKFLHTCGADVHQEGEYGCNAVYFAARNNDVEMAKILLDIGVEPSANDDYYGDTPLLVAIPDQHYTMAEVLLDCGADVNYGRRTRDFYDGTTALHSAACFDEKEIEPGMYLKFVRLLLDHGASASATDERGVTPLHLVICVSAAELLLQHGANPNLRDKRGRTPMHLAAGRPEMKSDFAVFRKLMQYGGDVNAKDASGQGVLHYVEGDSRREVLRKIIRSEAAL